MQAFRFVSRPTFAASRVSARRFVTKAMGVDVETIKKGASRVCPSGNDELLVYSI